MRGHNVLWQPEELDQLLAAGYGELPAVAKRLQRTYSTVAEKRHELRAAAKGRRACGAFLPDDGVPFSVVMTRLLRQ